MKITGSRILKTSLKYLGTIFLLAVVTVILKSLESELEIQLTALLYLLPVVLSTLLWGLWPGLLSGFLSFLCFNFLFLQPYYTFSIHKSQDVITLFVFLIVVIVVSQLIGQAKVGVTLAKMREWEATKMYELIAELAGLKEEKDIFLALKAKIAETFEFKNFDIISQTLPDLQQPDTLAEVDQPNLEIPMETRTRQIGAIRLRLAGRELSFEEQRLLHAFGYQGALAIERVHLFENENKARVFEESDRLKTSLLNSISHELRSPLAAIKASVSSLRSGAVAWDTPAGEELIATVDEETDQLNLLVGNLLDMSRIEVGALLPKKQWNSISEIISGVTSRLASKAQNHKLVLELPPDLPLVPTDFVMMEQVFTNLISNSIKYAPAETPILMKAFKESDTILIRFINQSPPVPEEHLEHIFDKFFRITKADKVTGTGLGLSICKGIIEAHGGKIWAENSPEGFCFNISLPLTLDGVLPDVPEDLGNG